MSTGTLHIFYLKFQGVITSVLTIFLSFIYNEISSFLTSKVFLVTPGTNLAIIEDLLHLAIMILTIASLVFSIRLSIVNHRKIKGEK